MSVSTLLFFVALVRFSIAGYVLEDDYSPSNFFSMFDFFTAADPTHGFVKYVSQSTAQSSNLISTDANSVFIGVDSTNVQPSGRPSVRLTSKKSYNEGLVIIDLAHMPGSICGSWPAFWMTGPNWPSSGEIDIIEGVNDQKTNAMTLHTGPGCSIRNTGTFSGSIATSNCDVNAAGQYANAGCSIGTDATNSYGDGFNAIGGGVYATLWTSDYISVFFFPRSAIPADITSGNPNPYGWGMPQANFSGSCDIPSTFKNLQIVFDTTFCGDWAGGVWSSGSCASKANTCESFVANNPSAFSKSFWTVNSLKVYQESSSPAPSSSKPAHVSTPSPVAPSSAVPTSQAPIPTPSSSHHYPGHHTGKSKTVATVNAAQASTVSAFSALDPSFILAPTTSLPATHTPPPFPAGNHTRPPWASGTAPFPACNHTRPAFGSGTISAAAFPTGNGTHHYRPCGTGFATVVVTKYLTVTPVPLSTAAATDVAAAQAVEAPATATSNTGEIWVSSRIGRPHNIQPNGQWTREERRYFKQVVRYGGRPRK